MKITGIVLAGGQSRRMGGMDKGLITFRGRPLIAHVLQRLALQVDEILISANRNLEAYAEFGYRVIPDAIGGFAGPLAGLQCGLQEATHPLVLTVPCDVPMLPQDLVERLASALQASGAQLSVAFTASGTQPVFSLCRKEVLPGLDSYLGDGGRKVQAWQAELDTVQVSFEDEAEAFMNINTLQERDAAE
jgi:molybdenum cofactor guanylyltransferase